jgi:phage gpG-like protein
MIPKDFMASDAVNVLGAFAREFESKDLQPAFAGIIDDLHAGFRSNFTNTAAPYGTWPPHSPYTVQKYGPHPLLILSGKMLASVTTSGSEGSIERFASRELTVGTSLFYAGFQQWGTQKIPARTFMWLDPNSYDAVAAKFAKLCWEILV